MDWFRFVCVPTENLPLHPAGLRSGVVLPVLDYAELRFAHPWIDPAVTAIVTVSVLRQLRPWDRPYFEGHMLVNHKRWNLSQKLDCFAYCDYY